MQRSPLPRLTARAVAFWHLTSLDAPTVAVVWAFAFARSAHVHLEPWIAFLLASGIWTVYVLDRILDARRATRAGVLAALHDRHHFHWRHRRILIPFAICTGAGAVAIIFKFMPAAAREHNSVLAAAALAYFSGVHAKARFPLCLRRLCSKEMLVGALFASGCAAPTLTRLHSGASFGPVVLTLVYLALLAWLNCVAIANWESQAAFASFPASTALFAIAGLAIAVAIASRLSPTSALLSCGALSSLLLLALHRIRRRFSPVVLRAFADLVLLVPAVLLIPGVLAA